MSVSLEHHLLKADLEGAARALGVEVECEEQRIPYEGGRVTRTRVLRVRLPAPTEVHARFVREGLIERAKKIFVDEVQVGAAWFDDLIYVVTSTPAETAKLLEPKRVQQALVLLVDPTRRVEIEGSEVRVIDEDAEEDTRDVRAELLAIVGHLLGLADSEQRG